ncbi:Diguanylate cyclase DosC [Actibacterium lipolyticum]|uniref:Diguanylate cyclase DosC n=2 Tax=Actibacterium lipolyticum TaxID=1524263 RepID=A0A238JRD0_9RHOB|nr:diguanylate cyclase [Actibacterium lipolyticum]SMX33201.1 Diguanylate cyclase DosC [Actibacterium lipolyticum]
MARLMPMHVMIDPAGDIRAIGPTLQKMRPSEQMVGRKFLDVFAPRRPRNVSTLEQLLMAEGERLQLSFRQPPQTDLKGLIIHLGDDIGALVNLSFGISVVDAVADYGLTVGDFAITDLTVEMLYLVEAKTAVMDESHKLNQRLQGAKNEAEEQAFTDTLTGLKNRRAMDHQLIQLIDDGRPFALMHLDLDYFKKVNDTYGHAAGDHVLQHVARVLVDETRSTDTIVRAGGDEFVLIFEGLIDTKRLNAIAYRIIAKLEQPITFNSHPCEISASIGTTISSSYDAPEIEKMLYDADAALYASKRAGRARATIAGDWHLSDERERPETPR